MIHVKTLNRKDKKWLKAVGSLGYCVLCGSHDSIQVAHVNESKGMGLKVPDCLTASLCCACHTELDSGKYLSRDERRQQLDRALRRTLEAMHEQGLVHAG